MNGYSGFKFGDARPYNPFSGGGSTFTGSTPPSYLSGLSSLATPEEWETQGTAFTQNPQMLKARYELEQLGAERERRKAFAPQEDELRRLILKRKESSLKSESLFQPQMDAIRGGIMSRMGGNLGVGMPKPQTSYSSGTGYTPSWMRSYQTPQFPNR